VSLFRDDIERAMEIMGETAEPVTIGDNENTYDSLEEMAQHRRQFARVLTLSTSSSDRLLEVRRISVTGVPLCVGWSWNEPRFQH
jgi:hypothetical protein